MLFSNHVLSMAGMAEAAEYFALMIGWGALALIGLLCGLAVWQKSWVLIGVSIGFWVAITFLATPWQLFGSVNDPDPDVTSWADAYRVWAFAWLIVTIGLGFAVATLRARRRNQSSATAARGFPIVPASPTSSNRD